MKTAIVWFKTDLRLEDNETLHQAIATHEWIIPVYVVPLEEQPTVYGTIKTGSFRRQFIRESVSELDARLREKGSGLYLLHGNPETVIPELAKQYKVRKVYCKKEIAAEEQLETAKVEKELWKTGCELEQFSTSTLYQASDLPFAITHIPDQFTSFRKKVELESQIRLAFPEPSAIKSPIIPPIPEDFIVNEDASQLLFKGGEIQAWKRLKAFTFGNGSILHYKLTRDELMGENTSSKLSPWLALGCISPRSVYYHIKQFEEKVEANESTYWLYFELLWRDFFRFMFKKHRQRFFLKLGIQGKTAYEIKENPALLEAWKKGETGNELVDAAMHELNATGFMSNRSRQIVASYFCYELQLDWRFGAAYFEQQLIDYDVSTNWGNWAYIAGAGNDPRGGRKMDLNKQAEQFDKHRQYRNLWLQQS